MKYFTLILALLLGFSFSFGLLAAENKKIEKKVLIKTSENKAGLGVVVSTTVKGDSEKSAEEGAKIIEVFKGSEADAIGLKKGDIIVEINGKKITRPSDLVDHVTDTEEGEEINLTILRDGKEQSFKATLKPFQGNAYAFHSGDMDNDVMFDVIKAPHGGDYTHFFHTGEAQSVHKKGGYLGVQVKELSEQLQNYFEVKNGVLIEEVMKDSPAEKAGLKAGDVVTSINNRKIEDAEDLIRTINYFNPEEKVELDFNRKGDKKEVTVVLDKKPGYSWSAKKAIAPQKIEWIDEDDHKAVIVKESGQLKTIEVKSDDSEELVEISEEILIF